MEKRKTIFLADASITNEMMQKDDVQKLIGRLAPYDLDIVYVQDHKGFTREEFVKYASNVEKNGPENVPVNEELLAAVADAEMLIVDFSAIGSKIIENAKKLKFIGVLRSGTENVNKEAASTNDVVVCCSPGRVSDPVADYTVGMILAESRNIARLSIAANNGQWIKAGPNQSYSRSLKNCTVGVVGFGMIGRKVALRLKSFGSNILVYDPFVDKEAILDAGYTPVSLEELLSESDIVTLHVRLSAETKNMIGKKELSLMKPTAFLVNTARARLVDEDALLEALQNKQIGGAGLDVFATEPLPSDHPFIKLDNVTLTPHKAGGTADLASCSIGIMIDEIERYLKGEALLNVVNKK